MKIEKRELSFINIIKYNQGYNHVVNLIGTSTFNKKCGQVVAGLGELVEDYNKRLNVSRDLLKEKYIKENGLEEFPWYSNNADLAELSKKERRVVSDWTIEFQKIKENLLSELCSDVEILELTEADIEEQEKIGKEYKEQGFSTTPAFFALLNDVIKD
jgi:hypothetical protein